MDNLLELMKSVKTLRCYEYYDGLQITTEYPDYLEDFEKFKNDERYFEKMRWGSHFLIPDDGTNLKMYQDIRTYIHGHLVGFSEYHMGCSHGVLTGVLTWGTHMGYS
jgi:hypothetical protein